MTTDIDGDARLWLVRVWLAFPMKQIGSRGQGLPETIEFKSIIDEPREVQFGKVRARFVPTEDQGLARAWGFSMGFESAQLQLLTRAANAQAAIESTNALTVQIIDDLGFRLLHPIWPLQKMAVDVTPPVVAGEFRETSMTAGGLGEGKFASTQFMDHQLVEPTIQLRADIGQASGYVSRSIDWFMKGLAAPFDADRFICFWIANEILAAKGKKESVPFLTRCGHELTTCPECGESLLKPVQGQWMRAYLTRRGMAKDEADAAWKTRQMLHGAVGLDEDRVRSLPAFIQWLKANALAHIKEILGIPAERPPAVVPGATFGSMGLGGHAEVSGDELDGWAIDNL